MLARYEPRLEKRVCIELTCRPQLTQSFFVKASSEATQHLPTVPYATSDDQTRAALCRSAYHEAGLAHVGHERFSAGTFREIPHRRGMALAAKSATLSEIC
jgi:hypothetical protein